jgi:virulence-associated protein VagC
MSEAELFKAGGGQAVRLPKAFRFSGDRVRIRKEGKTVVLEPIAGQALARGWTVETADTREFARATGLALEDWTSGPAGAD